MNYAPIIVAVWVGVIIGVAIMAMLQMSRDSDLKSGPHRSQFPPKRPPPPPEKMAEYPVWRDKMRRPGTYITCDSKRLNWLQESGAGLTHASKEPRLFAVIVGGEVVGEISGDIRLAIDSAMEIKAGIADETT